MKCLAYTITVRKRNSNGGSPMKIHCNRIGSTQRTRILAVYGLALVGCAVSLWQQSVAAAEPASAPTGISKLPVSINAVMVAMTDRSAEPFWNASQKRPETQKDWDFLQYYATDIALAGVLISHPGTGQFDAGWVQSPDWQQRAAMLTAVGMRALAAVKAKDQAQMQSVGNELVRVCNDCHMLYKPEIPSQGIIMHSQYYNPQLYGKPKR
jgi:hypothetical protein